MRITVLLFAVHRDLAGTGSIDMSLPAGADVRAALAVLRRRNGLAALPDHVAVAVNRRYAARGTRLREGDELALIPPVSGG